MMKMMKTKFNKIFENIIKGLDEKSGVHYPINISSFKFLRKAVFFNENGLITESDNSNSIDVFNLNDLKEAVDFLRSIDVNVKIMYASELLSMTKEIFNLIRDDQFCMIFKLDLTSFDELIACFERAMNKNADDLIEDPDVEDFFRRLNDSEAKAAFSSFEDDGNHYSLFLISRDCSDQVLCHELIHFIQYETKKGFIKNKRYLKVNPNNDTFGLLDKKNLIKVFNSSELVPYVHGICYVFEKNGISTLRDALNSYDKFKKMKETPERYISYCRSLPEYSWFEPGEKTPIHMLMLAVIYGRNLKIFDTIIAKYFKKMKK